MYGKKLIIENLTDTENQRIKKLKYKSNESFLRIQKKDVLNENLLTFFKKVIKLYKNYRKKMNRNARKKN